MNDDNIIKSLKSINVNCFDYLRSTPFYDDSDRRAIHSMHSYLIYPPQELGYSSMKRFEGQVFDRIFRMSLLETKNKYESKINEGFITFGFMHDLRVEENDDGSLNKLERECIIYPSELVVQHFYNVLSKDLRESILGIKVENLNKYLVKKFP